MEHPQESNFPTEVEPGVKIIAGRRYITIEKLAQTIGRTTRTLQRWHARRIGPPRTEILGLILYDEAKLPEWLARHEKQPVRPSPRARTAAASRPDSPPALAASGQRR